MISPELKNQDVGVSFPNIQNNFRYAPANEVLSSRKTITEHTTILKKITM
jgi:hypothetical protein